MKTEPPPVNDFWTDTHRRQGIPGPAPHFSSLINGFGPHGDLTLQVAAVPGYRVDAILAGKAPVPDRWNVFEVELALVAAVPELTYVDEKFAGGVKLVKFAGLLIAKTYDAPAAELAQLLAGSAWQDGLIRHALGSERNVLCMTMRCQEKNHG